MASRPDESICCRRARKKPNQRLIPALVLILGLACIFVIQILRILVLERSPVLVAVTIAAFKVEAELLAMLFLAVTYTDRYLKHPPKTNTTADVLSAAASGFWISASHLPMPEVSLVPVIMLSINGVAYWKFGIRCSWKHALRQASITTTAAAAGVLAQLTVVWIGGVLHR